MRAVLSVATLEMSRRILLLPAALVVGLLPFVVNPLLKTPSHLVHVIGLAGSFFMVLVVAAILGASAVGADLGAGRLSFFFSRPLAGWAIFAGKVLAAVLLTFSAGLLAALPVHVFSRTLIERPYATRLDGFLPLLGLTLFVILGAHFLGVIVRARSPWLILDVALLTSCVWWLDHLVRELGGFSDSWMVNDPELRVLTRVLWFLAAVLLATGLSQVVIGRTDLVRSHRAASLTFWPLFLVLPIGLALYATWLRVATSADLTQVFPALASRDGRFLSLTGPARGGRIASFLIDTEAGLESRRGSAETWAMVDSLTTFSEDGSRAFWLEVNFEREMLLRSFSLGPSRAAASAAALHPWPAPFWRREAHLGPGSEQVLLLDPHLSVYDTRSGKRTLWVPDLPGRPFLAAHFLSASRLRAYRRSSTGVEILEAVLPNGAAAIVGSLPMALSSEPNRLVPRLRFDRGRTLLLAIGYQDLRILVADAREGRVLREVTAGGAFVDAAFLEDGRVAVAEAQGGLRVMPVRSGEPEETIPLPSFPGFIPRWIEARPAGPGHLVVSLESFSFVPGRLVVVDLGARKVVRTEEGVSLLGRGHEAFDGTVVLRTKEPSFLRYDAATGERTVIWAKGQKLAAR
jgi:hypothetical protein